MCSINGFLSFRDNINETVKANIKEIIINGEQRGKDSFGYITINSVGDVIENKYVNKPSNILNTEFNVPLNTKLLLNNNRAEPTTEYVKDKSLNDVQPFYSENCITVHNGTIANDKQVVDKYNLKLNTSIDSAVIPYLFDNIEEHDYDSVINVLTNELIGSYALVTYNKKTETLYLATNYKPLYISYNETNDVLYFSSFEDYMVNTNDYNTIFSKEKYKEVKPYTLLVIHKNDKNIKSFSLYKEKNKVKKKALITASAGLDSTVTASWAINEGYDVSLLHYNYNCRADKKEFEHIKLIAENLNVPIINIDLDFLPDVIGGSNLFNNTKINKENGGKDGAELAIEWVPARNLIFLSIAAGYAEAHGFDYIILGGNLEESGAYSDNELIFQKKFNDILPNSLNLQTKVEILTPVANLMKKEIVDLGLKLKAPLHLTWSCYENGDLHCGECGPCYMRKTAFKMLNKQEVITYLK